MKNLLYIFISLAIISACAEETLPKNELIWKKNAEGYYYRVEVAKDKDFEKKIAVSPGSKTKRIFLDLNPGEYYARIVTYSSVRDKNDKLKPKEDTPTPQSSEVLRVTENIKSKEDLKNYQDNNKIIHTSKAQKVIIPRKIQPIPGGIKGVIEKKRRALQPPEIGDPPKPEEIKEAKCKNCK